MNSNFFKYFLFCTIIQFISSDSLFSYQTNNEQLIFENWIAVIDEEYQKESDQLIYDRISERFLELYYSTGQSDYLNFALNEASHVKVTEVVESLSNEEKEKVSNTIDKLLYGKIDSSYFDISEFTPDDIYKFIRIDITSEHRDNIQNLLVYWEDNLEESYQQDYFKGSFKAQALIWGYFLLNNDEKVVEIGRYLIESHPFPPSTFTLDLFNFLAFSARSSGYFLETLDL